jgi:hypothetical protein
MRTIFLLTLAITGFLSITVNAQESPNSKPGQKQAVNKKPGSLVALIDTTKKTSAVKDQQNGGPSKRKRDDGTKSDYLGRADSLEDLYAPRRDGNVNPELISALKVTSRSYKSKNGNVDLVFEKGNKIPKNGVHTKTENVQDPMCLTKEEVRGQKIENEIVIADGSMATQILPGGVIDANVLLQSGEFKFMNMTKRKAIPLTVTSNLAHKVSTTAIARNNNDMTGELKNKVHQLTRSSNLEGMPNMSSSSEASISTLDETTGINIGASFFYMGIKANDRFKFSSEKYRYMYLYTFEQACMLVSANNSITSPDDIFTEPTPMNNNWLYIKEVKYGRRLYVILESEYDLVKYSNELNGTLNWGVVSAKLNVKTKNSSLSTQTNIRVYTQGGQPIAITDKSQIQKELDKYFAASFKEIDIVPLAYKMIYMDGQLVSLVSNAFLNGKNCLTADKVRIRIKSIECKKVDDSKNNEELYGSVAITMFNSYGLPIAADGKTTLMPTQIPTGSFSFGSKDAPINLKHGEVKDFEETEQGKYKDIYISNLDMLFVVLPQVNEKDNVFNKDDEYITENKLSRTLRQMLLEGSTNQTFEFRRKGSVVLLHFEITPM